MRIALAALLALAVVAAPVAQAFTCRCEAETAAREAASACECCDGDGCDCCHDREQPGPSDGSRLAGSCACVQSGPLAPESPAFELPAPLAPAAMFRQLPDERAGASVAAEASPLTEVPRPLQVVLPLLI